MEGKHIAGAAIGTIIKIVVAAIVIMYVYRFAVLAYDYGYRIFGETPVAEAPGEAVTVAILEGSSVRDIGRTLEAKGLIRDADLFYWQEMVSSYKGELKAGVYELNTSMTAEEMMAVMAAEPETAAELSAEEELPVEEELETPEGESEVDR